MGIKMRIALLLVIILGFNSSLNAQFNFEKETHQPDTLQNGSGELYLSIYNNSFFKNNEYFLNTASGYTLFGTQFIPSLIYKPNDVISIQTGGYFKKDFGTDGYKKIAPYYLISLHKNGYSLNFGNINANAAHKLLDPIYANERLFSNFLEEGFSLKVNRAKIYSETWINWEKQQYYFSNFNEKFTVGHHTNLKIFNRNNLGISIPVQLLAIHSGGQLDTSGNLPTNTNLNAAIGIQIDKNFETEKGINRLSVNVNYLLYNDLDNNIGSPFAKGNAFYANVNIDFLKSFKATVGFFKGNQFIAPKGDILFQSISNNPINLSFVEKERQLLSLGFAYEKRVASFVNLSARLQPFYDFQNERLDYSYGLYLTLNPFVRLLKNVGIQ